MWPELRLWCILLQGTSCAHELYIQQHSAPVSYDPNRGEILQRILTFTG